MTARAFDDDPVLAALARAPSVPLTDEESALLAEVDGEPERWIPHADVARQVAERADAEE